MTSYPFHLIRHSQEGEIADRSLLAKRPFAEIDRSFEADAQQHGQYRVATWGKRWGISPTFLRNLLRHQFPGKRIAVVGDAIKDHYVFCDPANVAGEAPILSVKPLEEATYLGAWSARIPCL